MKRLEQLRGECVLNTDLGFAPFILRYRLRNSRDGEHWEGSSGVRDDQLVKIYGNALVRLKEEVSKQRTWSEDVEIEVFISDLQDADGADAIMFAYRNKPIIVLPSRVAEPTDKAEQGYAEACAFHEGSHVASHFDQPYMGPHFEAWRWFNEATAVWTELNLLSDNPSWADYATVWCDGPEHTLNQEPYWYGAGFFAQYLDAKDSSLLGKVWKLTRPTPEAGEHYETPMKAIRELAGRRVFHEYSVDSFFARGLDGGRTPFARALERFGGRAIHRGYANKGAGEIVAVSTNLEPLSTQYIGIWPQPGTAISLKLGDCSLPDGLEASLAVSSADWTRLDAGGYAHSGVVALSPDQDGFAVLVISNDGTSRRKRMPVELAVALT